MARDRNDGAARVTPFEPGIIQRVSAGVRFALTGKDPYGFFGPGQPIAPAAQDQAAGRQFDYPTGLNLTYRPRSSEAVDFPTLRALADNYDLLRLAIETRKDQMGKLEWDIVRRDGTELDATGEAIKTFFEEPDREHDFLTWQRMLHEDLFVLDAPTVYVRRTKGGQPYAFEPMDGATIFRVLNPDGRTPEPPDPAYQQILKGLPAVDYSRDELVYMPRNQRTHKVYGYSPVEQIILLVNIGLRRQIHQLKYYTDGNIPEMLLGAPDTWNPDQIERYQKLWDALMSGDLGARRRLRMVPGGAKPFPLRGEPLFDVFDEWLARVVCYCFGLPPNAFVKQQNRATAENAQEIALEEGLAPTMEWERRFMSRLIRVGWNTRDYEFVWQDEQDVDPLVQAQVDVMYTGGATGKGPKIRSIQEIRDDHDWGPLPADLAAEADAAKEMAAARLESAKNPPPPAPGVAAAPAKTPDDAATDAAKLAKAGGRTRRPPRAPY